MLVQIAAVTGLLGTLLPAHHLLQVVGIESVALATEPDVRSAPLTEAYEPRLETTLVTEGQPQATVLLPEDAAYGAVAREFVSRFEEAAGVRLPVLPEADFVEGRPEARAVVLFGNFATGPLALRLYANKLICCDGVYPGGGGFELRTIPDALDLGVDILFLGGSSVEGVRQAMDSFFAGLKPGDTISVPRLIQWKCPTQPAPGPISDEEIEKQVAAARSALTAFRSDPFRGACGRAISAARSYYLSGDDSWGRLYARVANLLAEYYADKKPQPPTFILANIAMALDQVEESAGLEDADRLRAAEWLRQMVEDTMSFWEMSDPIKRHRNGERRPIWNHETYPALAIAHSAQYLRARYHVSAAEYWEAVVDNLFAGQITCDQPLEDSANYQWSVPVHTMNFVLATGRLHEYLTSGVLDGCLEYAIASHDNQGNEATHGDAWQPFGSSAGRLFLRAVAQYHDPRHQWMLERIGVNPTPGLWQFAGAMESKQPDDHVGLRMFMVHPARVDAYGIEGIAPQRVLDKAVFRSGWERADQYIMLDGLNVGNHKHLDANAIIRFTDNRRLWLVDMDYIRAAPKYHNSIAVVRDGKAPDQRPASNRDAQVIAAPPFAAELTHAAGSEDRAMTQSLLSDYDGLDWRRSIFWEAKDFLVVIDDLRARSEADYIARCFWRTLGEAELDGSRLRVTQRGEQSTGNDFLRVIRDGERSVVEFLKPQAQMAFTQELQPGKYGVSLVARGLDGGTDSLWLRMDEGERMAYHLPIGEFGDSAGTWEKDTPGAPIAVERPGEHRFEISLRESPGVRLDKVILTPPEGEPIVLEAEDLVRDQVDVIDEPEQHFFIVNADGARLKLTESFDYGHGGDQGYYARYPYAGKMTKVVVQTKHSRLREGEGFTFANLLYTRSGPDRAPRELRWLNERAWMVTGEPPALVGFGPQKLEGLEIDAGMFMLTADRLLAADARRVSVLGGEWEAAEPSSVDVRFGAQAAALKGVTGGQVGDLLARLLADSSDPSPPLPLARPRVPRIEPRWRTDLGAAVRALAADEPGILCGTEEGQVAFLDSTGKVIWQRDLESPVRCVAFARFAADRWAAVAGTSAGDVKALDAKTGDELWSYECQPYHGRSGSVGTVFAADLDGDGLHEVVAGSDNHHYHALSSAGKLLWRTDTVHASTVGCAGDLTGDGRDDVVAGTEYYWPRLLDSTGKVIPGISGGPVTTAVNVFDTDGDGKAEAFIGMDDAFVHCARPDQREVWRVNVGGSPTAIEALDVDGDGKPEMICSSESFSVYAFDEDGSELWRTQLPEVVNDLAVVGDRIVAVCDDGRVYLIAPDGHLLATCDVGDRPVRLARSGEDGFVAAAGGELISVCTTEQERFGEVAEDYLALLEWHFFAK